MEGAESEGAEARGEPGVLGRSPTPHLKECDMLPSSPVLALRESSVS